MAVTQPAPDWKALFEQAYAGAPSAVAERVWRQVFGSEYPRGIDPHSYISASELERMAADARVGGDEVLVDLGCGRGGAGLWVAAATGARLIGIDIAPNALDAARRRAEAMGIDESRAEFREGSFERTGLPASSVDAVMSVDALLFSSNKADALRELRRVIRGRGRRRTRSRVRRGRREDASRTRGDAGDNRRDEQTHPRRCTGTLKGARAAVWAI
jgi:SAM-dependent methyltransferase